ncbi:MAG: ATP phosphoribosyltransferase [Pirellulaceae bacterium]
MYNNHGQHNVLRLALPKGRMFDEIQRLLNDANVRVSQSERDYRPTISLPDTTVKILKPRNVIGMLLAGARDIGFAGADWIDETDADLVQLLDTGFNPVRLVAAAPIEILVEDQLPDQELLIATEYPEITRRWIERKKLSARVLTTFGATEVFPPEDADMIVDNTATGSTLRANGLQIVDELMTSTTRLFASHAAMDCKIKRERIEALVMLLQSVLEARKRVMLDLNVELAQLNSVIEALPCLRQPTISQLNEEGWFAVRAAVPRNELNTLIPLLKTRGASGIVVTRPEQIIP